MHWAGAGVQTAVLRTAQLPEEMLEAEFAITSIAHRVCGWPQPSRDEVSKFRLDSLFDRTKVSQSICGC